MKTKNRLVLFVTIFTIWVLTIGALTPSTVFAASANKTQGQTLSAGGNDPDHDGLTNSQERACGTNPKVADSDKNGILDGADDKDHDGLSNRAEFSSGTKCKSSDSDHDGISDGSEVEHGTNPKKADSDGDGVKDGKDSEPTEPSHH